MAIWCYRVRLTGEPLDLASLDEARELGPAAAGGDFVLAVKAAAEPDLSACRGFEVLAALDPAFPANRPQVGFSSLGWS